MTKFKQEILTSFIAIFVTIVAIFIVFRFTNLFSPTPTPPEVNMPTEKEEIERIHEEQEQKTTDFEKYQKMEKITLFRNFVTTEAMKNKNSVSETLIANSKKISAVDNIKNAFLYIKANTGTPPSPLTQYDSVYVYIDTGSYGGHLLRRLSLIRATELSEKEEITELLYDFKRIPVTHIPYDDNAKPDKVIDFLDILKQPDYHYFGAFVSTLKYGNLIELTIGYECDESINNNHCEVTIQE